MRPNLIYNLLKTSSTYCWLQLRSISTHPNLYSKFQKGRDWLGPISFISYDVSKNKVDFPTYDCPHYSSCNLHVSFHDSAKNTAPSHHFTVGKVPPKRVEMLYWTAKYLFYKKKYSFIFKNYVSNTYFWPSYDSQTTFCSILY